MRYYGRTANETWDGRVGVDFLVEVTLEQDKQEHIREKGLGCTSMGGERAGKVCSRKGLETPGVSVPPRSL